MTSGNPILDMINNSECKLEEVKKNLETPLPEIVPQDLSGKVVIVTGANVGIGFETAKSLATMNPKKLIMACRNLEKARNAIHQIQETTKFQDIEAWQLDLASFASVKEFSQKFLATGLPLDILVSNAGVGVAGDWVTSPDGYEITLQVNHLANVLLISLLHPALRRAAQVSKGQHNFPRVVVVASDTHFWCARPVPDDPHPVQTLLTKPAQISPFGIYPATKLLNILFAKAYALKCPDPIWICSSNPGYTVSEIGAKDPLTGEPKEIKHHDMLPQRKTYEGAKTIIECAISPNVGQKGGYYSEMKDSRSRSSTVGETGKKFAENVWNDTIEILRKIVPENEIYSW